MKRRDEIDEDGDRAITVEWGDSRSLRVSFDREEPNRVYGTTAVRDGYVSLGLLDHEDVRALALFWADVAAAMNEDDV